MQSRRNSVVKVGSLGLADPVLFEYGKVLVVGTAKNGWCERTDYAKVRIQWTAYYGKVPKAYGAERLWST